ncbi:MAG TPA: YraN family protein [Terriglobales bacterium]|nr:YraN family protein [Terriglobales bacterium]
MASARLIQAILRGLDRLAPKSAHTNIPPHLMTGRRGEEDAYFYLRRKGYVIIARNFRTARHRGEIDLIGWDKDVLCFVEVKTRTSHDVKPAQAAVDRKKRRDLRVMIRFYLRTLPRKQFHALPQWRFDIVTVYYESEVPPKPTSGLDGPSCPVDHQNAGPPCRTERDKGGATATPSIVGGPTFELFQNVALSS